MPNPGKRVSSKIKEIAPSTRHYSGPGKIAQFTQADKIPGTILGAPPQNDVVENLNLEELASPDEVARDPDVRFRRGGITARMIVLCGAPVYVQTLMGSIDVNSF